MSRISGHPDGATTVYPWPTALAVRVEEMLHRMEAEGRPAERIEITFGPGAMEILGGGLLRRLTDTARFNGVPVEFPERPSVFGGPDVQVMTRGGGDPGSLTCSQLVPAAAMKATDYAAEMEAAMRRPVRRQ